MPKFHETKKIIKKVIDDEIAFADRVLPDSGQEGLKPLVHLK
jgi:hypothetical protein